VAELKKSPTFSWFGVRVFFLVLIKNLRFSSNGGKRDSGIVWTSTVFMFRTHGGSLNAKSSLKAESAIYIYIYLQTVIVFHLDHI
jgi:hypothetical protein